MTATNVCTDVVASHLKRLSEDFAVWPSERGCFVATPFTRPDGEVVELEILVLPNGSFRLTDMGDSLGYLYVNGLTLTRTLLDKARDIARGYGVSLDRNALIVGANGEISRDDLHRLVQATLAVTSLIHGSRSATRVIFDDEVESFIIQTGVTYDSDYRVQGQRESHTFKFHVNSGANLLIQPVSAASESAAHAVAERWAYRSIDVVERAQQLNPVVLLDDRRTRSAVWTERARAPVNDFAILWGDRSRLEEMLVAALPS